MDKFKERAENLRTQLKDKLKAFEDDINYFISGSGREEVENLIDLSYRRLANPADLRISLTDEVIFDLERLTVHHSSNQDFAGGDDIAYSLCIDETGNLSRELDVYKLSNNWAESTTSDIDEVYRFLRTHNFNPSNLRPSIESRILEIYSAQLGTDSDW